MLIKENALVVSADGKHVGHVHRIVLDPRNGEIKAIVVRKGLLLAEDRVVPMELMAEADDEQVRLKISAGEADKLPLFEEAHYVSVTGIDLSPSTLAPAYYWYPPVGGLEPGTYTGVVPPELMGYELRRERHIPPNTVALREGASVKSHDHHEVGKVEQVLTAPGSDQATHIVIAEGRLHKTRKLIPLDWVERIEENQVLLAVASSVVEHLPVYEHQH